jgi:MSHA biogenesis protein MshJ
MIKVVGAFMATNAEYQQKFLTLSQREQLLILITGLVVIIFGLFNLVVDQQLVQIKQQTSLNQQLSSSNQNLRASINEMQLALNQDPNLEIKREIQAYQQRLTAIDQQLLTLTSELISPTEMRHALTEVLKVNRGVKLLSFEVLPATLVPLSPSDQTERNNDVSLASGQRHLNVKQTSQENDNHELTAMNKQSDLQLYKHGIKFKLKGSYFKLRDYLQQLEQLQWKFFWQQFNYQLTAYPNSELEIELYSLSTKRDFIGV